MAQRNDKIYIEVWIYWKVLKHTCKCVQTSWAVFRRADTKIILTTEVMASKLQEKQCEVHTREHLIQGQFCSLEDWFQFADIGNHKFWEECFVSLCGFIQSLIFLSIKTPTP
jgi:hypothetical protein